MPPTYEAKKNKNKNPRRMSSQSISSFEERYYEQSKGMNYDGMVSPQAFQVVSFSLRMGIGIVLLFHQHSLVRGKSLIYMKREWMHFRE